jgi:hypothetical protein
LEATVTALQALLKTAEGAKKPKNSDPEILDSLKSLSDDTEEVTAFLHNLADIDKARAGSYLIQCRTFMPSLYTDLKQALDELPPEEEAQDEEEMLEDEMPPEEEGQDEELPVEDEELPEGQDEELPVEELPEPEGQDEELSEIPPEEEAQDEELDEEIPAPEGEGEEEVPFAPPAGEGEEEAPIDETEGDDEEVAVEPIVDQDELESEEASADDLDMVLFESSAKVGLGPHWSVFFRGRPLCAIRLADQENPAEIKELFVTDEYPKHVKDACASPIGIKETLNSLNALWYMGVVGTGQVAVEARQAAATQMEDEFASRLASLKEDLLNTINLAIVASNKGNRGLFIENTLKSACAQVMRDAGVAGASSALNEIWAEAAQTYMQNILKVAEKWLSYSPEAMQEVTAEIVGTVVDIEDDLEEETPAAIQAEARRQVAGSSIQNVPIRTRQAEEDYRQTSTQRVASTLSRRMGHRRMGS